MKNYLKWILLAIFLVFVILLLINKKDVSTQVLPGEIPQSEIPRISPIENQNQPEQASKIKSIKIAGQNINVELAISLEQQQLGLSGRKGLGDNQGMLFVIDPTGSTYASIERFWMKDMLFSLDMIWIGNDHNVIYIKKNATPESYPNTFGPDSGMISDYVLEINAGFSDKNNLKVGDKIEFGY